jgi:hypothetical protein
MELQGRLLLLALEMQKVQKVAAILWRLQQQGEERP